MGLNEDRWLEAQTAIIGALLIQPKFAPQIIQGTSAEDYEGANRTIYEAASKLLRESRPIDVVSILNEVGTEYRDIILQLMQRTPSAANIDAWLAICKEQSRLLSIRMAAQELSSAVNLDDARRLISKISSEAVDKTKRKSKSMSELLGLFFERHSGDEPTEYLDWGIACLNNYIFCEPGDFVILAGYRSDGKSALALQVGLAMSKKHKVGVFSLETSEAKFADRLVAHIANINATKIKKNTLNEEDWQRASAVGRVCSEYDIHFEPAAGMSPDDVLAVTISEGYEVIIIDYLQLLTTGSKSFGRVEEVTRISMALHTMAQKHGIVVIALSQLSRPEKNGKKPPAGEPFDYVADPQLNDLRESGQLEQDADIVLMIHRPFPQTSQREHILRIAKNKDGELRRFEIDFDGATQTFSKPSGSDMTAFHGAHLQAPSPDLPFNN